MHLGVLEKTAADAAAGSIMNDEGPAVVDISAVSITSVNISFEGRLAGAIAVVRTVAQGSELNLDGE